MKTSLNPFCKLGIIATVLADGERDYLRTILDVHLFDKANRQARDRGEALAGGSIERAEEILAGIGSHLAEMTGSES